MFKLSTLALTCLLIPAAFCHTNNTDALIEQINDTQDSAQLDILIKQLEAGLAPQSKPIVKPVMLPIEPAEPVNKTTIIPFIPPYMLEKIKEHEQLIQSLESIKENKPWLLELFMRHQSIIATPAFVVIKQVNPCWWFTSARKAFPGKCAGVVDQYLALTDQFFTMQEPVTTYFAYQIAYSCLQLELLKNDLTKGIIPTWLFGTQEVKHLVDKMLSLMLSIQTQVTEALLPKTPTVINSIMTGNWLKKITGFIEHPNGMFSLDIAHDLLKNKQFKDLGTMGLWALAYASPSIFMNLLNFFKPALKKDAADYVAAINQQQATPEFLVNFVDNHPDLFAQITTSHPEILDLLALQLRNMVQPPHRV